MTFRQFTKLAVFTCAKWMGLFLVSRFLTRRRLMILGYHGFQYSDEASFQPILFMDAQRFAERLDLLKRGKFAVLPLAEGVRRCKEGTLPANAVTITIDDGFFSVLDLAAPILRERGFPATLYVTSYYVNRNVPIFRLAIRYMFWKTELEHLELANVPWFSPAQVDLKNAEATAEVMWRIIDFGEQHCDEGQRQQICADVAAMLEVDFESINRSRALSLLTRQELQCLEDFGIDVQLHTHRHTFPFDDLLKARDELRENRMVLEEILGRRLQHFCYPSGAWDNNLLPVLSEEGILSATTCQAGMNDQFTNSLALYRVLDQDNLHSIEFEAEITGFAEMIRVVTGRRKRSDAAHGAKE